jgi:hypothetical protein
MVQHVNKPAVVHEVVRPEEIVEVQPVIERQRERLDVYEVVQPMRERDVIPTEVRQAVLPAQTRATVIADQSAFLAQRAAPGDFSTREVAPTVHAAYQNVPIVHETITHKVVEEVQPVIYKEIDRPVLIKETLPIHEKIVESPHTHHTVLPVRDTLETRTTVVNDIAAVQYTTTGLQSGITSSGIIPLSGQPVLQQSFGQQLPATQIPYQTTGLQSVGNLGQPLPGQGLAQPLTGQGFTQPLTGQGYAQGMTQPLSGQGFTQPATGQGFTQPLTQSGFQQGMKSVEGNLGSFPQGTTNLGSKTY